MISPVTSLWLKKTYIMDNLITIMWRTSIPMRELKKAPESHDFSKDKIELKRGNDKVETIYIRK